VRNTHGVAFSPQRDIYLEGKKVLKVVFAPGSKFHADQKRTRIYKYLFPRAFLIRVLIVF